MIEEGNYNIYFCHEQHDEQVKKEQNPNIKGGVAIEIRKNI